MVSFFWKKNLRKAGGPVCRFPCSCGLSYFFDEGLPLLEIEYFVVVLHMASKMFGLMPTDTNVRLDHRHDLKKKQTKHKAWISLKLSN